MPIPTPKDGESQDDFHGRCMSAIWPEFKDKSGGQEQANAICYSAWRRDKSIDTATGLTAYDLQGQRRKEAASVSGDKHLYCAIQKIEKQGDGTIRVHGVASTEDKDDQGEIILASAMRAAIPGYMQFPALREMHGLSAAGTTLECVCGDDGVTHIVGHVVDPIAVKKVENQVYRGFSIGGRVQGRVSGDYNTIDKLQLQEISLVDRPANPKAVLNMWKAAATERDMPDGLATIGDTPAGDVLKAAMAIAMSKVGDQVWPCGDTTHAHTKKEDAARCILAKNLDLSKGGGALMLNEDTAKLDVEPPASPKPEVESDGNMDGDEDDDDEGDAGLGEPGEGNQPVGSAHSDREEDPENKPGEPVGKKADDDEKEKPYGNETYADPGYRNGKARYPLTKDGKPSEERIRAAWSYINMPKNAKKYSSEQLSNIKGKIRAAMKRIGAEVSAKVAGDDEEQQMGKWLQELLSAIDIGLEDLVIEKAGRRQAAADRFLMNVAHDAIGKMTDGQWCAKAENATQDTGGNAHIEPMQVPVPADTHRPGVNATQDTSKRGARHSRDTLDHLRKAHDALCRAGAACAGMEDGVTKVTTQEQQVAKVEEPAVTTTVPSTDAIEKAVRRALKKERERSADVQKGLNDQLAAMSAKIEEIAKQPLPGTAAGVLPPGVVSVSKAEDGGANGAERPVEQSRIPTAEEVAKAMASLSEEDRFRFALGVTRQHPYVQRGR